MNIKELQKRVAIKVGIALAVITVLGGIGYALSSYDSSREQEQAKLKSQLDSTNNEARSLKDQIEKAKASLSLYNAINGKGNDGKGLALDRDVARKLLDKMKEEYRISSLNVKIGPVSTSQQQGAGGDVQPISSNVEITFEAFTDEQIIAFVDDIKSRFPGYVRLIRFDLSRARELSRDILVQVTRGNFTPLVKAEVEFNWMGLKIASDDAKQNPATPSQPAMPQTIPMQTPGMPVGGPPAGMSGAGGVRP